MTTCRLLAVILAGVAACAQAPLYEIRGTIVDHLTNRPINKALVQLTPITGPGELTFITAEDGRFGFVNVPKGKYRLMAQRRGHSPHFFHENGQYSTAIVVGPGLDATRIVFPLRVPASITGTVVDEDGVPMPSASVTAYREVVNEGEKRVVQIGNYQTDSAGQFRAGQLPAGTFFIAVQAGNGQTTETTCYPVTYNGDTTDARAAQPIVLGEGESAQIHIALHPAPSIHVPFGQPGTPMPQLFTKGPGGVLLPAGINIGSSDGISHVTGLPAGRYLVRLFSGGDRTLGPPLQEVELADGVPLALQPSSSGTSISGTVAFEGISPPSGVSVGFSAQNGEGFGAFVKSDGKLTVLHADPGSYQVILASNDYYIKSMTVEGAQMSGDRIELAENCQAKLSIVAAPIGNLSKLEGFALRDGNPIAGAMVLLVPHDNNRGTLYRRDQTDSDGSFSLMAIIPGEYTLVAIDDEGRNLLYKDPAVIRPYLAAGESIVFPRKSDAPFKITVQPRLP